MAEQPQISEILKDLLGAEDDASLPAAMQAYDPTENSIQTNCAIFTAGQIVLLERAEAEHGFAETEAGRMISAEKYTQEINFLLKIQNELQYPDILRKFLIENIDSLDEFMKSRGENIAATLDWDEMKLEQRREFAISAVHTQVELFCQPLTTKPPEYDVRCVETIPGGSNAVFKGSIQDKIKPQIEISDDFLMNASAHEVANAIAHETTHFLTFILARIYRDGNARNTHPLYPVSEMSYFFCTYGVSSPPELGALYINSGEEQVAFFYGNLFGEAFMRASNIANVQREHEHMVAGWKNLIDEFEHKARAMIEKRFRAVEEYRSKHPDDRECKNMPRAGLDLDTIQ